MNARDLAVKFDAYRHYAASREWTREHSSLPKLLCVTPDIAQERRIQRAVQSRLTQFLEPVVWTTTAVLLKANGPTAPIWMPVITAHRDKPSQASGEGRRNVFDVGDRACD